jgi:hypothetical protein
VNEIQEDSIKPWNEIRKTIQEIKEEINKDMEILKKIK